MKNNEIDLTILVPEFPEMPHVEIPRDSLVNRISSSYGVGCQRQVVISDDYYGKTNLLSQFCRRFPRNAIGYFITANPITQNYRNFLYVICNQISRILKLDDLPVDISEANLKSIYPGLSVKLTEYAKVNGQKFYIVIDGVEFALDSEVGSEIVTNPPILSSASPYLLFSSSLQAFEKLPEQFRMGAIQHDFEAALQFNYGDTEKYLSNLDLTSQEIQHINEKSKGIAGYLSVLRDSIKISGKDWIYAGDLPDNLKKLISKQVSHIFNDETDNLLRDCIDVIAISPKPIHIQFLQEYFGQSIPCDQLINSSLVIFDQERQVFSVKQNIAKLIIEEKIGNRKTNIRKKLLETVQGSSQSDDKLLTLLLEQLSDYKGLAALLDTKMIKESFEAGNIHTVMERMRKTSKLALETNEIEEIAKWSWGLAATKEFLSHASTTHEINALIAIGESQRALEMAYNFPETISKIRLLSRVYSSMKDRHEHVSMSALDELEVMIDEERIDQLDKEVVQDIAIDILPLLPDKAVVLLEGVLGETKEKSLIDVAISTVKSESDEQSQTFSGSVEKRSVGKYALGKLAKIHSSWLRNLNLAHLIKEVEELENTKAKEFMIRQWCLQNTKHDELAFGIEFWLETVIHDENFVISLRSLRQLSRLLQNLSIVDRRRLLDRFKISAIDSLRTPWEEWAGFHLNMAEAMSDYEYNKAVEKVDEIYKIINVEIGDFDIKVFCYARLWGTCRKLEMNKDEDVKNNLERVLSHLLKHAALHDEILNKTLRILAGIDIDYALEVTNRLNTVDRRKLAKKIVIITGYRKQPGKELSIQFRKVLKELDILEQDDLLYDLIEELSDRKITIDLESQKLMFFRARDIKSHIDKSITLVNLASIWTNESVIGVSKMLHEALECWKNEDDLKKRIVVGFQLVEQIAQFDNEFAVELCEDIQSTLIFPGAELAVGGLGVMYVDSIDLAIRSLTTFEVNAKENLEKIFDQIEKLPATFLRHQLYAQLAAKIYSIGLYPIADEIVQDHILQSLIKIENKDTREKIIRFALPVIFGYSQDKAIELSIEISQSFVNRSWFRVMLWSLSKGLLGDVQNVETIKVAASPATLRDKAFIALKQIKEDVGIYIGVRVITRCIECSVRQQKLDVKNAFDILHDIEIYVNDNLPDKNNINHHGYRIISLARINGTRSQIYKDSKRKGPFSKIDIRDTWRDLEHLAKTKIENLADTIFVTTNLAEEMFVWDSDRAEILLESISDEIKKIPSILDRSDRIDSIAKTWGMWGQIKQASFFYSQSIELINELSSLSQDKKLEHIVQAAYEISPDFADELVERLDSRFPDKVLKPFQMKLQSMVYSNDLGRLITESRSNQSQIQGLLMQSTVNRLLNDLVNQNGHIPSAEKIQEIVYQSSFYEPDVVNDVMKWALECENSQRRPYKTGLFEVFIQASEFIHELAKWVSPLAQKGLSQDIYGLLPGLSSKVVVFQVGQRKRAVNWVKNWITRNADGYIKICDPYFGPKELAFLSDIQRDIKILIITTSEKFENKEGPEKINQEILQTWRRVGKGKIPSMTLLIVPAKLEKTFHDRAIVTNNSGLNVGPSLNGLGNEMQRITVLEPNDARELEVKYIDDMLSQGKWFVNHSIHPEYIIIK